MLDLTGTRTPTPRLSSPQPVAIPTALPRLIQYLHIMGAGVGNFICFAVAQSV
jgi:hypothetical protein